jgi:hypothetical protein
MFFIACSTQSQIYIHMSIIYADTILPTDTTFPLETYRGPSLVRPLFSSSTSSVLWTRPTVLCHCCCISWVFFSLQDCLCRQRIGLCSVLAPLFELPLSFVAIPERTWSQVGIYGAVPNDRLREHCNLECRPMPGTAY